MKTDIQILYTDVENKTQKKRTKKPNRYLSDHIVVLCL